MKKRLLFSALVSIFAFPFCVSALDLDSSVISFTCDKDTIAKNEQATCTIKANLGETSVSGFSTDITLTDNLVFVSFEKNRFFDAGGDASQIDNSNSYTIAMNNSNGDGKSGNFDIGTLVVKASPDAADVATISFQNTKFAVEASDNTVDGNVTLTAKDLTIGSNENSEIDNENNDENTNVNPTTDNTGTNTDSGKKTSSTTSNPKTGINESLLDTIVILAVCVVSYLILRKKNFFNEI